MYLTVLKVKAYSLKLSVDTLLRRERITYNLQCMIVYNTHEYLFYRTSPEILSVNAQTSTQIVWASEKKTLLN